MAEPDDLEIQDSSGLTDADWAEINKLRNAHKNGRKAVETALDQLANDPIRYAVVIGAFFPDMVREMIRDQMADAGITEEDIRELLQKAEQELEGSKSTKH
jgi:hypothetical protein